MTSNSWIVTTSNSISNLLEISSSFGGETTIVAVGLDTELLPDGANILSIAASDDVPFEAIAPQVAETVTATPGDIVLLGQSAAERVFAGAIAAKLGSAVIPGAKSFKPVGEEVEVTRIGFGGIVEQVLQVKGTVVAVVDGGKAVAGGGSATPVEVTESFNAVVESVNNSTAQSVDLSAANRIVSVGRGFKAEADLELAKELAAKLGAEIACSRPVAEGQGWVEKSRYIGVTGQHVSPNIYVALGISGQLQHMVGCQTSKVIVAVNSDEKAPIFEQCDYGVVGDIYTVLPEINNAL